MPLVYCRLRSAPRLADVVVDAIVDAVIVVVIVVAAAVTYICHTCISTKKTF